jgi:hypothetical protein
MSGASKNRKYRAAHEASLRRASEEVKIQNSYISFYNQFNSGSPSIAARGNNNIMQPYQNYESAGSGKGKGAVGAPTNTFSWVTPDSYRTRISTKQGITNTSTFGMNAASYKSIADMLRPKAINAELSNLSGAYASQSQLIKKGPQVASSKRNRGSNQKGLGGPTAAQQVMFGNAAMNDTNKLIMGVSEYNNANSSSKDKSLMQNVEKVLIPNQDRDLESTITIGSATWNLKPDNTKPGFYKAADGRYKDSYEYFTNTWDKPGNINVNYNKKSEDFQELLKVREEFSASKDPADQIHLATQEKIYKDGQRNAYLQNFAFGGGTLSIESSAGIGEKAKSLRASKSGNYTGARDIEYNKQVAQFRADQLDTGLTDREVHANISKNKTETKATMSLLGGYMMQYEYLKKNKNSSQAHKDKVSALHAKVQLSFPGLDVSGNSAQMIEKLEKKINTSKSSLTKINAQQDAMGLYMAKNRIIDIDVARGKESGYKNILADKERKAKVRAAEQAAAQKAFDELWREGAGQALMSDSSVDNLNPERMVQAPSKSSELTRVVGIVKKYDAWDQRRSYISGELDTRRSNLNTYYNSNWEQDFTVSDMEASQYMFGSDTPSGTSLTRDAVTAIGINQRKPRKAIEDINTILSQTGENRSVYAENLAGIETKLLTLKEKQALKKAENDAIKARIAQQVTDDFNAGNVEINETFRDSITGTSEELYDLNTQVAEHNTIKTYYDKSLAQTDEDTAILKKTLGDIIKVKQQNDYDTITSGADDGGENRSQSSLGGFNKARRFQQPTGGNTRMVRSGGGKIQRTRSGKNLSGLVI